jgi:hypothetical protein
MRKLLPIVLLLKLTLAYAGGDNLPMGARFAGMGYTGLTLADLWGVRLNPAGIAGVEVPTAGLFYQRHFLSEELSHQGLAVALPVGSGVFAVAADRFGYTAYNETHTSLAYGMSFGDGLRAAVQMDHLGVRLGENYGSAGTFIAQVGMQARLTENIWMGAHLYNPTRASIGGPYDERVPTILRAGLTYTFSDKLLMNAEAEKDIDQEERYRFGIEYRPNTTLFVRTGISTGPIQAHGGVGFRVKQLDIDLAVAVRSLLGPTPMLGLNYRFK